MNSTRRRRDSKARRARIAKGGGVQFPRRRERRYLAAIDDRITASRDLVVELLTECLSQFESQPAEVRGDTRLDAEEQLALPLLPRVVDLGIVDERALLRMVDTARLARARLPPADDDLLGVAEGVDTFTTGQVSRVVETVVGIDPASTESLEKLHAEWVKENVDLITSIDKRFFADIAKTVREGVANGRSTAALARDIESKTGVARRRAQLIARDQVATLNGKITKARQEAVGVARYEWSTSLDERVRPEHAAREGVVFDWSEPPPDGHPGEPINCRCVAIPVFEDVKVADEAPAAEVPTPSSMEGSVVAALQKRGEIATRGELLQEAIKFAGLRKPRPAPAFKRGTRRRQTAGQKAANRKAVEAQAAGRDAIRDLLDRGIVEEIPGVKATDPPRFRLVPGASL